MLEIVLELNITISTEEVIIHRPWLRNRGLKFGNVQSFAEFSLISIVHHISEA